LLGRLKYNVNMAASGKENHYKERIDDDENGEINTFITPGRQIINK